MKRIRYFILSAGVILLAAALSRFLIAAGNAQVMDLPEPCWAFRCAMRCWRLEHLNWSWRWFACSADVLDFRSAGWHGWAPITLCFGSAC